jgi:hypothetical protein
VIHPLADPSRARQSHAGFSSVLFLFATQKHISNVGGPKTFNPQTLLADPKECRRRWGRLTANGMLKCLKQVGETEPGQFSHKKKDCFFFGRRTSSKCLDGLRLWEEEINWDSKGAG